MHDKQMTEEEAVAFVREKDDLVADFARTSYGISPDEPGVFDVVIDTGKVDPGAAVRFLVEVAGALSGRARGGPRAADLQVGPVIADAVSNEFERLERLRAEGYEVR